MARGRKRGGGNEKRKRDNNNDDNGRDAEKPGNSSLGKFLRKRAPIYLGLIALFVVFAVPELTKGDLAGSLPELAPEEQRVVDILMSYDGPNETGLTVMEALSGKIAEQYPDERIYDNKKTSIDITVSSVGQADYRVLFDFKSHKGQMSYDWNVNTDTHEIVSNDQESKHIIELVDFYD